MASSEVREELANLETSSKPSSERTTAYNDLLKRISQSSPADLLSSNLIAFLESIMGDALGIVASRPLLAAFVETLRTLPSSSTTITVCTRTIAVLQSRIISFEEEDSAIRDLLAGAYEAEGENILAAQTLKGIQLESSSGRSVSPESKIRVWIRIVRNYLEEGDSVSAETYLNKAKTLLYRTQDQELKLLFQLSQARILDAHRKFLDAGHAYYTLSASPIIVEDERLRALSSAIVCGVLAPAGPQRARLLAKLYKDERAHSMSEYGILEKIFLDRVLSGAEVEAFATGLAPHQLAVTADGSTVLAKAVIEHNLLGASRLYDNIRVEQLGRLLGLPGDKAEEYAARMIEQGRLSGRIDGIDRLILFDGGEGSGERTSSGQADRVVGRELRKWDANVQGLAEEVERVTSLIRNEYPEFVVENMAH